MSSFDEKFQKALAAVKAQKAAGAFTWSSMTYDGLVSALRSRLSWLDQYMLNVGPPPLATVGERGIHLTFAKAPRSGSELQALNAPQAIMLSIESEAKRWPQGEERVPGRIRVSQFRGRDLNLKSKAGPPEKIVDYISDFFQQNVTP